MNIRIDDRHAYVEIEVFGRYQTERIAELLDAMRVLAERHGHFSELEIHHGKPENMFAAIKMASMGGQTADYSFIKKMRKYALVADNPGFLFRLTFFLGRFGPINMRLFKMHERDAARQWIEQA